jgi:hypothetical protein
VAAFAHPAAACHKICHCVANRSHFTEIDFESEVYSALIPVKGIEHRGVAVAIDPECVAGVAQNG